MKGFQDAVLRGLSAAEQETFDAYNSLREAEREEANLVEESKATFNATLKVS